MMLIGHGHQEVMLCKDYATKYCVIYFHLLKFYLLGGLMPNIICSNSGVANPGPGEPQGVLPFVVTQQLIEQLKQLITQLTLITWFLTLNWSLIIG